MPDRNKRCRCANGMVTLLAVVAVAIGTSALAQPSPSRETRGSSIVIGPEVTILLQPGEPAPIQQATQDIASDFEKVFGAKPRIVTRQEDAGSSTIMIGEQSQLPEAIRPSGLTAPESFSISVHKISGHAKSPTSVLLLTGADMRGTIYAIYQFSQEYLGVDPMYYWTDHEPVRRTRIEVPASLDEVFPAPVFKYRGFFLNDEDLLTGWAPGEKKDKTGISLKVWNKVYETILRLKGNMVVPGTWIFPDDPQIALAAKRGLIINQHHAIPLGLNVARWPRDVPYNYTTHPEILERAWTDAVATYPPHQEILWSVGLRGLSDVSYASMDPSVRDNDNALGALISKAITDQMSIVRASHPNAKFVTDLWQEGARLVRQGNLTIPPEVTLVWADTGYGYLQDNGQVRAGQGAYYHVAMMNDRSNQLTEMVPVDRIDSELGRYIKAKATAYLLLNTSDIRPVSMTTRAVMDIAWKGLPPDNDHPADTFYRQWATEEFGAKAAPAIVRVYEAYFQAPAHFGTPPQEYGDQLYHTESRRMMLTYMIDSPLYSIPSQAPKWEQPRIAGPVDRKAEKQWLRDTTAKEIQQCGDAQPRWDAVWKQALAAEPLVAPSRLPFYRAQVLAMIAINRESNRTLFLISKAIQDASRGDTAKAHQEAEESLNALDNIHRAETDAEYGKWKNWYRGDWLTGIPRTRETVKVFANFLDDPSTPLPQPLLWNGWEGYYHIMHYEGDRSAEVQ